MNEQHLEIISFWKCGPFCPPTGIKPMFKGKDVLRYVGIFGKEISWKIWILNNGSK